MSGIKVEAELTLLREAEVVLTDYNSDEHSCWIDEQAAVALVCQLIKVFQVPNSNIEVIHFPEGASKAECLRNAADILDREGEGEVSCPPYLDRS
jgi:hypothetical protein